MKKEKIESSHMSSFWTECYFKGYYPWTTLDEILRIDNRNRSFAQFMEAEDKK
jgi:hypothetical protein